jgi:hypothetical protein
MNVADARKERGTKSALELFSIRDEDADVA